MAETAPTSTAPPPPRRRPLPTALGPFGPAVALCLLHTYAVWLALEGRAGLVNGWPLWRDDHPLFYHYARIAGSFLRQTWTTAGYDPSFMAGHAKSIHFPPSATLAELVLACFGGPQPALAYKLYVLTSVASVPWLVALAARLWRLGAGGVFVAVAAFLVYLWTDFPINYAAFGMVPYLLAVPLGLAATAVFVRFCETGRLAWWLASAGLMVAVELVHTTSVMVVAPAAAAVYLAAALLTPGEDRPGTRFPGRRHLGVWAIPVLVVACNAFWWLPAYWLAATKGESGFAFAHPEGVWTRLRQIVTTEAPVERWLCLLGLPGLVGLVRRDRAGGAALVGFTAAGFAWGYLAGGVRALDALQPGRHTFAFYTGLSVASGFLVAGGLRGVRGWTGVRLDAVAAAGLLVLAVWGFGREVGHSVRARVLSPVPFLSSRPSPRLLWVLSRVRRFVNTGERLYYEEGGFGLPGVPDPFQGGRFSGLIPDRLGVEVIGGPYLHAALTTNFTQFGEGKLFGRAGWGRDWFVRYARLYRPSAILCWSPHARAFCRANPDLIEVKDDDGVLMIARVIGFGGFAVEGKAEVAASPGLLRVTGAEGGVDGTVVLRYHSVPCLRTDPPVALDPVYLEDDPVPFIRLRPPPGAVAIELRFPPGPPRRGPGR